MNVGVKIILDSPLAKMPKYAKEGDAGADVFSVANTQRYPSEFFLNNGIGETLESVDGTLEEREEDDFILLPKSTTLIPLGFRVEIPSGWELQVRSRSGMAKRGVVVANSPGTIDSSYRGQCMVLLHNSNDTARLLKPGTRIAQFVLKQAPQAVYQQVLRISDSDRGTGGFGSTGIR